MGIGGVDIQDAVHAGHIEQDAVVTVREITRGVAHAPAPGNQGYTPVSTDLDQGLKIVTLLRLSPVFPFNLLNYGLGLTRVRLVDYVLACFGMLPGTLLYVYYGRLAGDVAALASGVAADRDAAYWVVLGLGLVATIAVTTIVTRIARRALGEIGES